MEERLKCIEKLLNSAIDILYEKDRYLIDNKVHERAIVFRTGLYLQILMSQAGSFEDFNLDFEYNRNGTDLKRLPIRENGAYPDLIVHKRGNNNNNLLIMEFKTYWNQNGEEDTYKIKEFINPLGEYGYFCGKRIVIAETRDDVKIYSYTKESRYNI